MLNSLILLLAVSCVLVMVVMQFLYKNQISKTATVLFIIKSLFSFGKNKNKCLKSENGLNNSMFEPITGLETGVMIGENGYDGRINM